MHGVADAQPLDLTPANADNTTTLPMPTR